MEELSPSIHRLPGAIAQYRLRIITFARRVEDRAAALNQRFVPDLLVNAEHRHEAIKSMALAPQSTDGLLLEVLNQMVKGGDRQLLLAAKVIVETAFLQTRGAHQIGHRCPGIALLIEQPGGLFDDAGFGGRCRRHWLRETDRSP